jgi:hypothetical protein
MYWRLRIDISDDDHPVILIDNLARYLTGDNLTKETSLFHATLPRNLETELTGYRLPVKLGITEESRGCLASPEV